MTSPRSWAATGANFWKGLTRHEHGHSASPSANHAPRIPETPTRPLRYWRSRARTGLIVTLIGFLIFLLGARPSLFGLDRSPVIGFVQIAVFLVGLAIICLGGYHQPASLWKDHPLSIAGRDRPAHGGDRLRHRGLLRAWRISSAWAATRCRACRISARGRRGRGDGRGFHRHRFAADAARAKVKK